MRPASNPVIAGCFPDPSVCRVGADYYLVASSFAYFPGLPLFHSTDLVNWELIGHALDRTGQLELRGYRLSEGIWAATIRFHRGTFYIVYTVAVGGTGSELRLITSDHPGGSWSDPVVLEGDGIDPDLFFDADGKCWLTASRNSTSPDATGPGEIWTRELDLAALRTVGPTHVLWHGALAGAWVEAPHIYLRDGVYHLLAAEGGTERNHAITAARAPSVIGPYTTDPRSPLLTHRNLASNAPFQNVGHADLVTDENENWWAVMLGVRPIDGFHTLGREVFLAPVVWELRGPVFAPATGRVEELPELPAPHRDDVRADGEDVDFAEGRLGPHWVGLRSDLRTRIQDSPESSGIRLSQSANRLDGLNVPSYVGRRVDCVDFLSRTLLSLDPSDRNQQAGMAVLYDERNFSTLMLGIDRDGASFLEWTVLLDGEVVDDRRIRWSHASAELAVASDRDSFHFRYRDGSDFRELGRLERPALSTERIGGFLGIQVGLYAFASAPDDTAAAHFSAFHYSPGRITEVADLPEDALAVS